MLSGTCFFSVVISLFLWFRGKSIWAECHLTALKKMLAVIAGFNVDNHVTINFQDDESLILENYLSL